MKVTTGKEWNEAAQQCDQIWRFMLVLGDKFSHKSSPNFVVDIRSTEWRVDRKKNED